MAWIKIDKAIVDSYCFANANYLKIWLWLLIKANYKKGYATIDVGNGITTVMIDRGQILFGRFKAEKELNINGSMIYRAIKKFQELEQITVQSNNKYSIITICNYDSYQGNNDDEEQYVNSQRTANEQQVNNKRTTSEQQVNTSKEYLKNNKEYKEKKEVYSLIFLTDEENQKLCSEYGDLLAKDCMEYLSAYKQEKNYKTKSDYLTIKRWVVDAVNKKNINKGYSPTTTQSAISDVEEYKKRQEAFIKNTQNV